MTADNYWTRAMARGTSRRRVLGGIGVASLAVMSGGAIACGGDDDAGDDDANPGTSASPTAAKPVRGGELIVRRPSATTFADPHRSSSGYDPTFNHLYAAPLLASVNGKISASLVESWEQADLTTAKLTLRKDLKFTDGTPVNAAAVKYALERQADPKVGSPRRSLLAGVTIETPDDFTAVLKFSKPNPAFLESLTMNAPAGLGALISPTAHQKLGDDKFNEAPVSVGPFKISKLALDGESVFVPNPDWPVTAPNGDKLPYLDKVIFKVIPQTAVAVAELQSGGIDLDYVFLGENVGQIKSQPNLAVSVNKGAITQRIGMNLGKAPTNIVAFRKALNHAFDREEFALIFTDGLGSGGRGPLTNLTWAYDSTVPYYSYDVAKAKSLLAQAGVAEGTKLNICTYTSGVYPRIGEMIQAQAKKVGLDVQVDNLEVPVITEKYRKNGEYLLGLEGGGAPQGDPYQYLETNFGSANQPGGTKMPEVDALLAKALAAPNDEERKKVYGEIVKLDYDNSFKVWLLESPTIAGYTKKTQGLVWLRSGSAMDVTGAWKQA
ncbi:ABC transporter substrate-binding protein [Candidatus Amarobacter glycogenicus]|uniref:ABC transporter substrate-binding protein n=1 Tax=Candidatus Amarobacter glycogenicus TaxID=3140699 RepID=UPI0031374A9B|nr:ABC transporter substrate-binding protein [Dehalococcoidia bacterium]